MSNNVKPVFLLVFANDRTDGNYLRDLVKERRDLEALLKPLADRGILELVILSNVSLDELTEALARYAGRIAVFHYGGHATEVQLLLESREGSAVGVNAADLAPLLAQQHNIQCVFLNGCLTLAHSDDLLNQGIPAVIGTVEAVRDDLACAFAGAFYTGIAANLTLDVAFTHAVHASRLICADPANAYGTAADAAPLGSDPWPWSLRIRRGAEEIAAWNLTLASGDFLFGLPGLPDDAPLPNSPFHSALSWYTEAQAELFFGRNRQIRQLFFLLAPEQANETVQADAVLAHAGSPVVLLYGQSGVGKSSFLEAGLLPRLKQVRSVRYTRRNRTLGLRGTLVGELGLPIDASDQDILAAWKTLESEVGRPLVVLLDQVEEALTLPIDNHPRELDQLAATIAAVFNVGATRPQGKLLLSFRKEHFADIDHALQASAIDRSVTFLERLDHAAVVEIVNGPASTQRLRTKYHLTVDPDLPDIIAHDLTRDPASPIATVLHILLTEMWQLAFQRQPAAPCFDVTLYNELRGSSITLKRFFDQRILDFQTHQGGGLHSAINNPAGVVDSGLLLDLLEFHTTPLGTAEQRSATELEHTYAHRSDIHQIVQAVKDLRLLSDPSGERYEPAATQGARLAHDTLAPIVVQAFNASTLPGQRARRILENRTRASALDGSPALLDDADLQRVESGLAGMRSVSPGELYLIQSSQHRRSQDQRRRRLRNALAFVAVAAILVLALVSLAYAREANTQRTTALANAAEAQTQAASAQRARVEQERQLGLSQSREVAAVAENRLRSGDAQAALQMSLMAYTSITRTAQLETVLRASLESWRGVFTLPGHSTTVTSIFFSRNGRMLATSSMDATARVWDLKTGQPLLVIRGNQGDVTSAVFSMDSQYLITSSRDSTIRFWTVPGGQMIKELAVPEVLDGVRAAALHPNERWIAFRAGPQIWLYDIDTQQPVGKSPYTVPDVPADTQVAIRSLAFTADGRQILAGADDSLPHIWNIETGQHAALGPAPGSPGHQKPVLSFVQSSDGRFLASLSIDRIMLWEADRKEPRLLPRPLLQESDGATYAGQLLFSPDNHHLAAATTSGIVRIWDLRHPDAEPQQLVLHSAAITGMMFSPDGRLLASTARDGTITLWNMQAGVRMPILTTQTSNTSAPVFSRDGAMLATADANGTIYLWESRVGGDVLSHLLSAQPPQAIAAAGSTLVIAGNNGVAEFINTVSGNSLLQQFNGAHFSAAAANAHDGVVALADATGNIALVDPGKAAVKNYWQADQARINALVFLPELDLLAAAGATPGVSLWSWRTGQLAATLEGPQNEVVALVHDVANHRLLSADRDGAIHGWQLPDFSPLPVRQLGAPLTALAISPDGSLVAAADTEAHLLWWQGALSQPVTTLAAGTLLRTLAFAPDGRLIAGGENGEVQVWNLRQREVVPIAAHNNRWVKGILVNADGEQVISIGDDGLLKSWLLAEPQLLALGCHRVHRLMSPTQWDQLFGTNGAGAADACAQYAGVHLPSAAGRAGPTASALGMDTAPLPSIYYLESVQGTRVPLGTTVTVRWSVENAVQVNLEYQGRDNLKQGNGEQQVQINGPVTFRLQARNAVGTDTQELTILPEP